MSSRNFRIIALAVAVLVPAAIAWAEYADVVINETSEIEGMSPVIYPHWFHRIRYECSVCHVDLGFKTKAGGNGITMEKIVNGEFCGACHDGTTAWTTENCDLCHSGKPGLETGIEGGHETSGPGIY